MRKSRIFASFFAIAAVIAIVSFLLLPEGIRLPGEMQSTVPDLLSGKTSPEEVGKSIFGKLWEEPHTSSDSSKFAANRSNHTRAYVYPGGTPIGIKLYCDGVIVVGTEDVTTAQGVKNPAKAAGLAKGDVVTAINGTPVSRNSEVSAILEKSNGDELLLEVRRNEKKLTLPFRCVLSSEDGRYKAGLWIRDSAAGIGTLSFCLSDGRFASLGHAVCDVDTGEVLPLNVGEATQARITGLYKGTQGTAGELCGVLEEETIGSIVQNGSCGIYGKLARFDPKTDPVPVALDSEVHTGEATILTTVEQGVLGSYQIQISKLDAKATDGKNMVIQVTDPALIEKTGGIIQGMSGSPILQDGKLVGAVTHVFLGDPTGGYGILASTMLEKTESVSSS